MVRIGRDFYLNKKRCVSLLLLLSTKHHQWEIAAPAQCCSLESVVWRGAKKDVPHLPDSVLAGTFQTRTSAFPVPTASVVPPIDGPHIVHTFAIAVAKTEFFLRLNGEVCPVKKNAVIIDEWNYLLRQVMAVAKQE